MKELLNRIAACCAALALLAACDKSGDLPDREPELGPGSDCIFLDFSAGAPAVSRAAGASAAPGASGASIPDTELESRVDCLDVLIFTEAGAKVHYERIVTGEAAGSTAALSAKRSSFAAGAKYWVYLLANCSDEEAERFAESDFDRNALLSEVRTDRYLHLTGLTGESGADYTLPQRFLMDGVAYAEGAKEPGTPGPVVLNNGVSTDDTYLNVTLRRAAVKLVLEIVKNDEAKDRIIFIDPTRGGEFLGGMANYGGYYLRNMPFTTPLVSGESHQPEVRTTLQTLNRYFEVSDKGENTTLIPGETVYTAESYTITAYVYAHNWEKLSAMKYEPRWIVDLPLWYDDGARARDFREYADCYYQIPVCSGIELKRNTCYKVRVKISQPGGTNPSDPLNLTDLQYTVQAWEDTEIPVGGEDDRPRFLTVNRTKMEMRNIEEDNTTLQFASSSAVTAEFNTDKEGKLQVYYENKFGVKTYVSSNIRNQITLTPDPGLNGGIKIHSPNPTNNTIRYIEIKVKNEDGLERLVTIEQYPLEYITNIQSWYSYRDDFKDSNPLPTTYEYQGDRIVGISYNSRSDSYSYNTSISGFWRSKVAGTPNSNGKSTISYYSYSKDWWSSSYSLSTSTAESNANARMYYVRIEASSNKYTIGRPRLIKDQYNDKLMVTDSGADNAKLVSPSFMIASRLGFVNTSDNIDLSKDYALKVVREHCAQYVEVYKDENGKTHVLDDWRLPTTAELKIIMEKQGTQSQNADAIDYLLNAEYYWSASERVKNTNSSSSGTSIRCIRDAYEDPTDTKAADPAAGAQ